MTLRTRQSACERGRAAGRGVDGYDFWMLVGTGLRSCDHKSRGEERRWIGLESGVWLAPKQVAAERCAFSDVRGIGAFHFHSSVFSVQGNGWGWGPLSEKEQERLWYFPSSRSQHHLHAHIPGPVFSFRCSSPQLPVNQQPDASAIRGGRGTSAGCAVTPSRFSGWAAKTGSGHPGRQCPGRQEQTQRQAEGWLVRTCSQRESSLCCASSRLQLFLGIVSGCSHGFPQKNEFVTLSISNSKFITTQINPTWNSRKRTFHLFVQFTHNRFFFTCIIPMVP